jgi:type IV fimbrial biogenesis protein FimT
VRNYQLRSAVDDLVSGLQYARTEAVKRNDRVRVDQRNGANWSGGTVIWVDADGDNNRDADETLRLWEPLKGTVTITSNESGFVFTGSGAVDTGDDLTLCDARTAEAGRQITLLRSGALVVVDPEVPCD